MNDYDASMAPSFWKKAAATWIDFILLIGAYFVLGFISERLFLESAYPPARGMQLYSERDFIVYWFFVSGSLTLTAIYLLASYTIFKATLGQKLTDIRLLHKNQKPLKFKNIFLRTTIVLGILLFLMFPGPLAALLFILIGESIFNTAFSVMLLLGVIFGLFFLSVTRYNKGKVRSFKDKLSQTIMVDLNKVTNKQDSESL